MKKNLRFSSLILALLLALSVFAGCENAEIQGADSSTVIALKDIPPFKDEAYVAVNGNVPFFTEDEITDESFEYYGELDELGRCTETMACIGTDIMPTEKRGEIGMVKPSGWQMAKYDFVDGKYLYNRCHLIGFQLAGENANVKNLITGTRYLNIKGMLPFENMVADYVKETDNHVMYRVTPIFEGDNLLADGVLMEGYSVEDKGKGVSFCVFAYNAQPGVTINYADGTNHDSSEDGKKEESKESSKEESGEIKEYILNKDSKKFHDPSCKGAASMKANNKEKFKGTREEVIKKGYEPCGVCKP